MDGQPGQPASTHSLAVVAVNCWPRWYGVAASFCEKSRQLRSHALKPGLCRNGPEKSRGSTARSAAAVTRRAMTGIVIFNIDMHWRLHQAANIGGIGNIHQLRHG